MSEGHFFIHELLKILVFFFLLCQKAEQRIRKKSNPPPPPFKISMIFENRKTVLFEFYNLKINIKFIYTHCFTKYLLLA